jgi:RimJ/RimL family protein N-acetyltransferase
MPTNHAQIRDLTPDDAEIYREIRLRALQDHPEAFGAAYEESAQHPLEWFTERLNPKDGAFILGAFSKGKLVGTVGMFRNESSKVRHKGIIWGMHTVAEVQGQGVGRALLIAAIERARQIPDLDLLQLSVVTTNSGARNLYLSCGFKVYGLEPHALKLSNIYLDEEHMFMFLAKKA